ncbi:MAG: hypothetical protein LBV55_03330 [Acholeplasmatales bacterium]|nr:hypothetical protein [Acholeplasmatales bacterium]
METWSIIVLVFGLIFLLMLIMGLIFSQRTLLALKKFNMGSIAAGNGAIFIIIVFIIIMIFVFWLWLGAIIGQKIRKRSTKNQVTDTKQPPAPQD